MTDDPITPTDAPEHHPTDAPEHHPTDASGSSPSDPPGSAPAADGGAIGEDAEATTDSDRGATGGDGEATTDSDRGATDGAAVPLRVSRADRSVRVPRAGDDSHVRRGGLAASNWLPTRSSALLVVLVTAVTTFVFASAAGLVPVAVVGALSALSLAGALRLSTVDRWRVPATLAATALLVPVGAGLAGSLVAGFLVMQDRLFPVTRPAAFVTATLRAVAAVVVVAGASLAWFGAATAVRDTVRREPLRRTLGVCFRTALPPFLVAGLGGAVALAESPLYPPYVGGEGVVGIVVGWLVHVSLDPPTLAAHPTTLTLLVVLAAAVLARLVDTLPVAEVAGEDATVVRVAGRLGTVARVGIPLVVVAAVVEYLLPARTLTDLLGFEGYRLFVGLTTSPLLRVPLVVVVVLGGAAVLITGLLRRAARTPAAETVGAVTPYLVGVGLALLAGSIAAPVVDLLVEAVRAVLISPFDERFAGIADTVVEFYGPGLVLTALLAGVLVLTAGAVLALYLADRLGYVRDRANGASLAASGLFVAATFAVPVGAPATLAFGGLVGAVLVWDVGLYGASLGREVGRRAATVRVELTHATSTLVVGALGVVLARALLGAVRSGRLTVPPGVPVASAVLLSLAGLVVLVAVLRATE